MSQIESGLVQLLSNPLFLLTMIWALIWKGIALWKAARNGSKIWYIILLIVNTVGILEIVYIFFFGKKKQQ